jgi:hypothetical protein
MLIKNSQKPNIVVAIHQPNFFPWLGFFNKIARSNIFILADTMQFPKSQCKGNWLNRVRILINGKPHWITAPIQRSYHGVLSIDQIQFDLSQAWRQKLLRTVKMEYGCSPFFNSVFPFLQELIEQPTSMLCDFNISVIRAIARELDLNSIEMINTSSLTLEGKATDLLISIIKSVGGDTYLCGGGASEYQEDEKFSKEGIDLIYQNFIHPHYSQIKSSEFNAGLSIIDALMNCGFAGTRKLIQ